MATHSGDVGLGLLVWLQRAGLAGLSEIDGDLRDVRKAAENGDEHAAVLRADTAAGLAFLGIALYTSKREKTSRSPHRPAHC